jgi:hypothetical protein
MQLKLRGFIDRYWILFLLIIIKFILQVVVVNPVYELHRDEFLYLDQATYNMIPANERENTLVICYNYGQAGTLNYFNRKKMPEAYAYNTDYIYWLPRLKKIQNILLVGKNPGQQITGQFKD